MVHSNGSVPPEAEPQTALGQREKIWTPVFGLLLGVQFTYGTAFSTFFALPKYLIQERAAGASLVGNAHGAFAFTAAGMAFVLGPLLDRYGRRPILVLGLLLGIATYAPFGAAEDQATILLLRALHGVSFAAVFNAGAALAVDLAPFKRRGEAIGYFGSAMLVTNALGPALAEPVASSYGWQTVFAGCSICATIALLLAIALRAPARATARLTDAPGAPAQAREPLNVPLLGAYLGSLAIGIGVGSSKTFLPALLVTANLGVGLYFVFYTGGAIVQRALFGWVPDRLGHHWTFRGQRLNRLPSAVFAVSGYGLALAAAALAGPSYIYGFAPLVGLAHGLAYPSVAALAVDLSDPRRHGRTTAWLTGLFNLGWGLSTAGLAPLQPWIGYDGLLLCAAIALWLASLLIPVLVLFRIAR